MRGTSGACEERLPLTPATRAHLTAAERTSRPISSFGCGVALAVAVGVMLMAFAVPAGMPLQGVAFLTVGAAFLWGGAGLVYGLIEGRAIRRDLRDGVFVRTTGRIELDSAWDGEQTTYALLVGERRFGLACSDFLYLWGMLEAETAAPRYDLLTPPANLAARATVSYLAHSGMLLEVHDGAGRLVYCAPLYRLHEFNADERTCPKCSQRMPRARLRRSVHQRLWGGWTCPGCGYRVGSREALAQVRAVLSSPVGASVEASQSDLPRKSIAPSTGRRTYELRYSRVDVFAHPDVHSQKLGALNRGDEFDVISPEAVSGREYEFYRVRASSGLEGFVFAGNVRLSV